MFALLIQQVGIMFLLMLVGWLLYRKGKINQAGSQALGVLLVYVIMPSVVFNAYLSEFSWERLKYLGLAFLFSFLALGLAMLVAHIFFKKKPIENFGTAFSNAGFMGIPIIQAVFGTEAVFYASSFVALLNFLQWTYGVFLMSGDVQDVSLKKIIFNPILISLVLGLVVFVCQLEVPAVISQTLSLTANMNAPVAMISLGTYLAQMPVSQVLVDADAWKASLLRLVVIPLLSMGFFQWLPTTLAMALMLAASTPIGSNVAIFAELHHQDYKRAVRGVCLSTLLSLVTMPLMMEIAGIFL